MDIGTGRMFGSFALAGLGAFKIAWPSKPSEKEVKTVTTTTLSGGVCGEHHFVEEICRDMKTVKGVIILLARTNPAIDDETLRELVG